MTNDLKGLSLYFKRLEKMPGHVVVNAENNNSLAAKRYYGPNTLNSLSAEQELNSAYKKYEKRGLFKLKPVEHEYGWNVIDLYYKNNKNPYIKTFKTFKKYENEQNKFAINYALEHKYVKSKTEFIKRTRHTREKRMRYKVK